MTSDGDMGVRFQGPVTWPQICVADQVEMYCKC